MLARKSLAWPTCCREFCLSPATPGIRPKPMCKFFVKKSPCTPKPLSRRDAEDLPGRGLDGELRTFQAAPHLLSSSQPVPCAWNKRLLHITNAL
jgi:hypothetical protein